MITVLKPGMLTTIQDSGRHGFQKFGVVESGPMDPFAHRIANLLVGNEELEATLEITLLGPSLQFDTDLMIALCGGNLSPSIDGSPIRMWRPIFVKRGSQLTFGRCIDGCRSYLAISGGFDVPIVMKSKSTYLRAEIGGYKGRALQKGDHLVVGTPNPFVKAGLKTFAEHSSFKEMGWSVASSLLSLYTNSFPIRIMTGPEFQYFTRESQQQLYNCPFEVSTQSDRMGFRLKGPHLILKNENQMISEAVSFGTIQVPPDGNPIILLADRQTTGGYSRIGQVATVDLPLIAQTKSGERIHFTEVSLDEAQRLYIQREQQIKQLKNGIALLLNKGDIL